ncbi:hypothetical protein [Nostoc sp.]
MSQCGGEAARFARDFHATPFNRRITGNERSGSPEGTAVHDFPG